ncbi:MAG: hypothetical protein JO144_14420 [Actinobacteria bacterium]|nr:hypothetical protein [Actinomycetota bacterium]
MNTLEDRLRAALAAKSDRITELARTRPTPVLDPGTAPVVLLPGPAHPTRRSRGLVASAVAVAAMLLLAIAAVVLHRATSTHRFDPAKIRPRSAVPWNEVGPGWTLVQEVPSTATAGDHRMPAGDEQLDLVGPGGLRYRVASLGTGAWVLADWDGVHQRALLQSPFHEVSGQPNATTDLAVLELRTGTRRSFTVQDSPYGARLGGPGGQHIVLDAGNYVTAFSLTGQVEQRIRVLTSTERTADSRDGRQLVVGGPAGLQLYDYADGRLVRRLPAPAGYDRCRDPRWSGDGTLVANCRKNGVDLLKSPMLVFSADGVPAAGRPDPRYRTVGDRVTGFKRGTVSTFYPLDDPRQPAGGSWPLLTRMTAARLDSTGRTSAIGVPAQFRAGSWMIADVTPDAFTVVQTFGNNAGLTTAAVSWNPFTGQVTELARPSASSATLLAVQPWGSQPY